MSWGYDVNNRVASMTNVDYPNENLSYTYDHDSQLTNAVASYGGYGGYGGLGGGTYSWDNNGDSTKSGWITGAGNRLLFDGTYSYVYDKSGHIVQRSTSTAETDYFWDTRGRLYSVKDYTKSNNTLTPIQQVDYGYDPFNDLISRTLTPYSGGNPQTPQIARFVYDLAGAVVAASPDPATGSGNAVLAFNGNGSMTDRYLWGPAVDQILADERFAPSGSNWMPTTAGTTYWALTDNENSVRDWITYNSLVDHIIYDSFGKVYSQSSTAVPFNFGHNGVFYDPATGLEYHSQPSTGVPGRWYNPSIQRWMSEDPSGLDPDSNPYRYGRNSPTNLTDPSGLVEYKSLGPETKQDEKVLGVIARMDTDPNIGKQGPGRYDGEFCGATGTRYIQKTTSEQMGIWIGKRPVTYKELNKVQLIKVTLPPDKNGIPGPTFGVATITEEIHQTWDIYVRWKETVTKTRDYTRDWEFCAREPGYASSWQEYSESLQYLGSVDMILGVRQRDESIFLPNVKAPTW